MQSIQSVAYLDTPEHWPINKPSKGTSLGTLPFLPISGMGGVLFSEFGEDLHKAIGQADS